MGRGRGARRRTVDAGTRHTAGIPPHGRVESSAALPDNVGVLRDAECLTQAAVACIWMEKS